MKTDRPSWRSFCRRHRSLLGLLFIVQVLQAFAFSPAASAGTWAKLWNRNFSGLHGVVPTASGGFAVAGNILDPHTMGNRISILRFTAEGALLWRKIYQWWELADFTAASGGGYLLVGRTASGNPGIMKVNRKGGVRWCREITQPGTWNRLIRFSLRGTLDGGCLVAGSLLDPDGSTRMAVMKLDPGGTVAWSRVIGTPGCHTDPWSILEVDGGGYVLVGRTDASGAGNHDALLIYLDTGGSIIRQKTYGSAAFDCATWAVKTSGEGLVVAGVTRARGEANGLLFKLSPTGLVEWQKEFGLPSNDEGIDWVCQTGDLGFLLAGYRVYPTEYPPDSTYTAGWLMKLGPESGIEWIRGARSLFSNAVETGSFGYITAGEIPTGYKTAGQGTLYRLNASGNIRNCDALEDLMIESYPASLTVGDAAFTAEDLAVTTQSLPPLERTVGTRIGIICP